jgi:hypothetical protein
MRNISQYDSGERCGPWASCLSFTVRKAKETIPNADEMILEKIWETANFLTSYEKAWAVIPQVYFVSIYRLPGTGLE